MPFDIDAWLIEVDTSRDNFDAISRCKERLLEGKHFCDIKSGYNRSTYIAVVFFFRRAIENKDDDY